ncbi:hypothetical protein SAMD00019534_108120 [Acytostelium subglobosum LB1]|uniref:hypothetical protein n=1 Tax=Acytostelium subglobosum LB1 TaxID=1410327 RepID=UPI000644D348|nr:hypothetical protein SAMD00019534_108120 [Acytostelium subglobosum LB1]GAM27636.1 hypothetical protein SAMD00019534_108120 [Acytostelium subglobosum LB1]|eukprot:XP_012749295.1 hypothetical protein SAMD00019534_108120 [Acytostelium subglobosum LB1]
MYPSQPPPPRQPTKAFIQPPPPMSKPQPTSTFTPSLAPRVCPPTQTTVPPARPTPPPAQMQPPVQATAPPAPVASTIPTQKARPASSASIHPHQIRIVQPDYGMSGGNKWKCRLCKRVGYGVSERYHCVECPEFDICRFCSTGFELEGGELLKIAEQTQRLTVPESQHRHPLIQFNITFLYGAKTRVLCSICGVDIRGMTNHCSECTNFDVCVKCFQTKRAAPAPAPAQAMVQQNYAPVNQIDYASLPALVYIGVPNYLRNIIQVPFKKGVPMSMRKCNWCDQMIFSSYYEYVGKENISMFQRTICFDCFIQVYCY